MPQPKSAPSKAKEQAGSSKNKAPAQTARTTPAAKQASAGRKASASSSHKPQDMPTQKTVSAVVQKTTGGKAAKPVLKAVKAANVVEPAAPKALATPNAATLAKLAERGAA